MNLKTKFYQWLAWIFPPELVLWCYSRVMAHGTTGKYGDEEVGRVTAMELASRWIEDVVRKQHHN